MVSNITYSSRYSLRQYDSNCFKPNNSNKNRSIILYIVPMILQKEISEGRSEQIAFSKINRKLYNIFKFINHSCMLGMKYTHWCICRLYTYRAPILRCTYYSIESAENTRWRVVNLNWCSPAGPWSLFKM